MPSVCNNPCAKSNLNFFKKMALYTFFKAATGNKNFWLLRLVATHFLFFMPPLTMQCVFYLLHWIKISTCVFGFVWQLKRQHVNSITQLKIHIGMRYKGSAAAETMMTRAASLPGQPDLLRKVFAIRCAFFNPLQL